MNQSELSKILGITRQAISFTLQIKKDEQGFFVRRLIEFALNFSEEEFLKIESDSAIKSMDINMNDLKDLLTTAEASILLGYKTETLVTMRHREKGPPFIVIQIGNKKKNIFYRKEDLEKWSNEQKKG